MTIPTYCAIGDIHGELDRLKALHRDVLAHMAELYPDSPVIFVHLGDLVDRGPASCGVIEYLMALESTLTPRPLTLRGNHEQMMIDALESDDFRSMAAVQWLGNGGEETMDSYHDKPAALLARHVAWLKALPTLHTDEAGGLVFVHAGIDPDRYPDC